MNDSAVQKWCRKFQDGRTDIYDKSRQGRLSIANADILHLVQ